MEIRQRVREVTVNDGWALVRLNHVPDRPGVAALIFSKVAQAGISVEMILQNASVERSTDVSFTVRSENAAEALRLLKEAQADIGAKRIELIEDLAMVRLAGTGILTDPSYVGRMFRVLADARVNILAIGTSEVSISCLVEAAAREQAMRALNKAFQVDQAVTAA